MKLADDQDSVLYTSTYIRRQVIAHFLGSYDMYKDRVSDFVCNEYGRIDSQEGPFSLKSWCEHILKDKTYCDAMVIGLLASVFGCRITVVRSDNLTEMRFRHNKPLENSEFVFLYNCSPLGGHYSACLKGGEGLEYLTMECEQVRVSTLYDREVDLIERIERRDRIWDPDNGSDPVQPSGSQDPDCPKVLVDNEEYKELKQKAATLDKILMLLKGQKMSGIVKPTGLSPGETQDEGQGSRKGQKKRRIEREFEEVEKLPEVQSGDVMCKTCNKKCKTPNALKLHIEQFHKSDFLYTCHLCGKGINTQEGITAHKLAHEPDEKRLKCPAGCDVTFGSKKSQSNHMKYKHGGSNKVFTCDFCKDTFKSKGNLSKHIMGCKSNPGRIEIFCDVKGCHKGGFYLPKKLNEHKRDVHGWQ